MKKLLLPIVTPMLALAIMMVPATANAAQCRNSATGKFAKCGTPGAVPASQYVAKSKSSSKMAAKTSKMAAPMAAPTPMPTKAGMMSMMKSKAAAAKAARCKSATGKFVKCGTPGSKAA